MSATELLPTLQALSGKNLHGLRSQAHTLRALRADGVRLAARQSPASPTSDGDFVLVHPLRRGRWLVAIGDAMGRDAHAGALAEAVEEHLRNRSRSSRRLGDLVGSANELVHELGGGEAFVSLLAIQIDTANQTFRIANAGHVEPLAVGRSGGVIALEGHGPALGLIPGAEYRAAGPLRIPTGVLLLATTDGVAEAVSDAGEHFGRRRTSEALAAARDLGPRAVVGRVLEAVDAFRASEYGDVATALAFRFER